MDTAATEHASYGTNGSGSTDPTGHNGRSGTVLNPQERVRTKKPHTRRSFKHLYRLRYHCKPTLGRRPVIQHLPPGAVSVWICGPCHFGEGGRLRRGPVALSVWAYTRLRKRVGTLKDSMPSSPPFASR